MFVIHMVKSKHFLGPIFHLSAGTGVRARQVESFNQRPQQTKTSGHIVHFLQLDGYIVDAAGEGSRRPDSLTGPARGGAMRLPFFQTTWEPSYIALVGAKLQDPCHCSKKSPPRHLMCSSGLVQCGRNVILQSEDAVGEEHPPVHSLYMDVQGPAPP